MLEAMRIARLFGIPVRVDWSWLLIFGLLVWTLAMPRGPFADMSVSWRLPVAALVVLTLFACVILHEAAHALTARRFGIRTREIELLVFGGVSKLEGSPKTPAQAAQISFAGPLASIVLAIVFGFASAIGGLNGTAQNAFAYLCVVNGILALFNLLPAYPMDGGRLFHALIWNFTRERERATRIAAGVSTMAGLLIAAAGLLLIARGALLGGMWVAVMAWFIMRSAQAEVASELAVEPLSELRAGSVADPAPPAIEPDVTCETALERMVKTRQRALPVVIGPRLLGLVTLADFAKLGGRAPDAAYVTAIMTRADRLVTLAEDVPALEAFKMLAQSGFRQLPVLDAQERLIGFIGHETVARALAFGMERAGTAGPALSRLN
jgi:Zn-dependent protease/CBS domain-containing protein